jgi:hypothetical protein
MASTRAGFCRLWSHTHIHGAQVIVTFNMMFVTLAVATDTRAVSKKRWTGPAPVEMGCWG